MQPMPHICPALQRLRGTWRSYTTKGTATAATAVPHPWLRNTAAHRLNSSLKALQAPPCPRHLGLAARSLPTWQGSASPGWQGAAALTPAARGCSCQRKSYARLRLCHTGFRLLAGQGFYSLEAWLAMRMARFLARDSERRSRCSLSLCRTAAAAAGSRTLYCSCALQLQLLLEL